MNIVDSMKLLKKYADCPNCGSDKLGDGEGSLNIENEIFKRTCKCGWEITIDKRIKANQFVTKEVEGKVIPVYEVFIHGEKKPKYLPVDELKQLANIKRINQLSKVEDWLNTAEGRKWALVTPSVTSC